jgi:hypothetical protein
LTVRADHELSVDELLHAASLNHPADPCGPDDLESLGDFVAAGKRVAFRHKSALDFMSSCQFVDRQRGYMLLGCCGVLRLVNKVSETLHSRLKRVLCSPAAPSHRHRFESLVTPDRLFRAGPYFEPGTFGGWYYFVDWVVSQFQSAQCAVADIVELLQGILEGSPLLSTLWLHQAAKMPSPCLPLIDAFIAESASLRLESWICYLPVSLVKLRPACVEPLLRRGAVFHEEAVIDFLLSPDGSRLASLVNFQRYPGSGQEMLVQKLFEAGAWSVLPSLFTAGVKIPAAVAVSHFGRIVDFGWTSSLELKSGHHRSDKDGNTLLHHLSLHSSTRPLVCKVAWPQDICWTENKAGHSPVWGMLNQWGTFAKFAASEQDSVFEDYLRVAEHFLKLSLPTDQGVIRRALRAILKLKLPDSVRAKCSAWLERNSGGVGGWLIDQVLFRNL